MLKIDTKTPRREIKSSIPTCRAATCLRRTDDFAQLPGSGGFNIAAKDEFGEFVSISGDTTIIWARWNNNNGSAYIFARNEGGPDNWGELEKLTAHDGAGADYFGYAVSISGATAVVGAYRAYCVG